MKRRQMIGAAGVTTVAAGLGARSGRAQETVKWNMVMPWPKNTPGLGMNAQRFAQMVQAMSGGRLEITVYGAGELVPPFESLDAVQNGTADIGHGTPYFWVGKSAALNYFTGVPFGLTAAELAGWLYKGDGMDLWRETYADFNVVPFYAGSSRTQAGGWFRKEIKSLDDLRGLKFRIAGLGGEVMKRLGVTTVLIPPGEIGPSLLSGAVDAAEWVGPWNDRAFGLYKSAKYYYLPAFHEPGPGLEVIVNKDRLEALPEDLRAIVEAATTALAMETTADFTFNNIEALDPLVSENDVELRTFPDDVVVELGRVTREVYDDLAATDELTGKIHESFINYLTKANAYAEVMDRRMLAMRALAGVV
ncbi:MAG: TRAP transporter substrate-binding protein [Geminicoccaceae bacterium]